MPIDFRLKLQFYPGGTKWTTILRIFFAKPLNNYGQSFTNLSCNFGYSLASCDMPCCCCCCYQDWEGGVEYSHMIADSGRKLPPLEFKK